MPRQPCLPPRPSCSAITLDDIGRTYSARKGLGWSAQERADLAQYLKSL